MSTWEFWRALKRLELHSAAPRATLTPLSCSPNFPRVQYLDIRTLTHELIVNLTMVCLMHQSIPPAPSSPPPLPRATAGHLPALSVSVVGLFQFLHYPGAGICQPLGHSRVFDTHTVLYQNITTHKVLLEKKQIGSSVKDRTKL